MLYLDLQDADQLTKALHDTSLDDVAGVRENVGKLEVLVPPCDEQILMDELDFRGIPFQLK